MAAPPLFDRHAAGYREAVERSISFLGRKHEFFLQAKADHLAALARRRIGDPRELRVLDVGCGPGFLAARTSALFGRVHGVDVSREALRQAARGSEVTGPPASCSLYDGLRLPFPDGAFDLLLAACLLHHVPRESRGALVREMLRVARPPGGIAVFEHNPFHPLTRLAVSRCAFDRGAELLSQGEARALLRGAGARVVERRSILLLPWRGRLVDALESALRRAPLGAQYMLFARRGP